MSDTRAISVIQGDPVQFMAFIDVVGQAFGQGGLPGCRGIGQGKALALTCLMEGMTPLQFMLQFHLVEGKPSKQATTLLAEFEETGGECYWLDLGDSGKEAKARWVYKHHDLEIAYTRQEAEAQVGEKFEKEGSNYKKNLGSMLRARLITKALRIVCPKVVAGIYTPEELGFPEEAEYVVVDASHRTAGPEAEGMPVEVKDPPSQKPSKTKSKPPKSQKPKPEPISETKDPRDVELEAKGEELLKDNDMAQPESEPEPRPEPTQKPEPESTPEPTQNATGEDVTDVGLPKALCTQGQLDELKQLILDLDFKDKFDKALADIGVAGAKNLTLEQAQKWIKRLKEIQEASK